MPKAVSDSSTLMVRYHSEWVVTSNFGSHRTDAEEDPPRRARRTRRMEFDELSNRVIGSALEVHRELGPGLLESTYEQCLAHELKLNGIDFKLQHPLPVKYKGVRLECGCRVDILVEDKLIIESKSVEQIKGIHSHRHPRSAVTDLYAASRGEDRASDQLQSPTGVDSPPLGAFRSQCLLIPRPLAAG